MMNRIRVMVATIIAICLFVPVEAQAGWEKAKLPADHVEKSYSKISTKQSQLITKGPVIGPLMSVLSTNETEATPEIQALARALQYDPRRIYEYVKNHIDYDVTTYGIVNGATGCLLAGRGNDWDQSALLSALLRESGFDTQFGKAPVFYYKADLAAWIGADTNSVMAIISEGGNPSGPIGGYDDSYAMVRVWVEASIGGTNYVLDPAWKAYREIDGINLASAMGYSQSDFISSATNGATTTSDYILNANETNIASKLRTYTTNLINSIKTNYPNATFDEIVSGRQIIPETITNLPTSLPAQWYVVTASQETWDDVPTNYNVTITIQHQGINETFKGYEIADKRISITYNAADSYKPQLWVDGDVVATGNSTTLSNTYNMVIRIDHAYDPSSYCDRSNTFTMVSGGRYVIIHDMEGISSQLIAKHSKILGQAIASGAQESSEAVFCGSMNATALAGLWQGHLVDKLVGRLSNTYVYNHHNIGVMAQIDGYYVDLPMVLKSVQTKIGDTSDEYAGFRTISLAASALEHGMLEQSQGMDKSCASTIKLLQISNKNSKKTYLTDSSNWSSIQSLLVNYTQSQKDTITAYISAGHTFVLPEDGEIGEVTWSWNGIAYIQQYPLATFGMGMIIGGGYSGGYNGNAEVFVSSKGYEHVRPILDAIFPDYVPPTRSRDPLDLRTGDLLSQNTDISLGHNEPLGLRLIRYYNSAQNTEHGPMGYGWTHGYDISAKETSNGGTGLGTRQPTDAAALIAQTYVTLDLMDGTPDIKDWVASVLATKWGMDQLIGNSVSLDLGNSVLEYVKLPDGSYNPPPLGTAALIKTNNQFILTERFGTEYTFNTNGIITTWKDADSNTLSFAYTSNNLSSVSDAFSRSLTFSYSGSNISSVVDSSGRSVSYQYTSNNLSAFIDPESNTWSYFYDTNGEHYLTIIRDALGQDITSNKYNALGKVEEQKNGSGNIWKFYIDGYCGIEENPEGDLTTYYFDDNGRSLGVQDALGNRTFIYYDGQGHLVTNVDAMGNSTAFFYDLYHNMTGRVDALTNVTLMTYDSGHHLISITDPLGAITQYGYDNEHHPTNIVDALTNATIISYYASGLPNTITDPRGNITTFTYDSYGNPQIIQRTDGGSISNLFNSIGDLLSMTDANGHTTSSTYDKRRLLLSVADASGYSVSNQYNAAGYRTATTDRNGNVTTFGYTPTYQMSAITNADGGGITYQYDSRDLLVSVTDPLGNITSNDYNAAQQLVQVTDALGNQTKYSYSQNGNLVAVTNALGAATTYSYDLLNRLTVITDSLNHTNSFEYDSVGRRTAIIDARNNQTTLNYDSVGRLISKTRPDGITEEYEFDKNGNLKAFVNGRLARTEFAYDGMNRLLTTTNANGNVLSLQRDPAGNVTNRIDGNLASTRYLYNQVNKISQVTYPDSKTVTYSYDGNQNVTNMTDSVGTTSYNFDNMNRLTSFTDRHGNTVGYGYNLRGNRATITYPGNLKVTNTFNAVGQLTAVKDWNNRQTTYSYNQIYSPTGTVYPNGVSAIYQWDNAVRLTGLKYLTNATAFIDHAFTLDAAGNISQQDINTGLAPVLSPKIMRCVQNDADMLLRVSQKTTPDEAWATNDYQFDDNGNQLLGGGLLVEYDYENMPTNMVGTNGMSNIYEYDGQGDRTLRNISGTTNIDVLDKGASLHNVLMTKDNSGNPVRYFIWGRGLIAQIEADETIHYFHSDQVGSTLALTDSSGNVSDQWFYSPYGEVMSHTGNTATPYTYVGAMGVWSEGNNLYYMKTRYYHAELKRFISADPIGLGGGGNFFAYCNGNPLLYIDPYGLCPSVWTRVGGGLQMLGGGIEAGIGYSFAFLSAETIVGAIAGTAVGLHGSDVAATGLNKIWTGLDTDTLTSRGMQAMGLSRDVASGADVVVSAVGTMGMSAWSTAIRASAATAEANAALMEYNASQANAAQNTLFHYTQTEISAGQGLRVGSGVTSVGNLNAQQAMLNLGINPPTYVYPVNLNKPLDYLIVDFGTPARNTIPSWRVIQQTPPGSVGLPSQVLPGN